MGSSASPNTPNEIGVDIAGQVDEEHLGWIEEVAAQALAALDLRGVELSVLLCDDEVIASLNEEWRDTPGPTDVLSFPQDDEGPRPPGIPRPLGDVVISLPTARAQAAQVGHELREELAVLLVHGLLHLLGHDHEGDLDEARRMEEAEVALLGALGRSSRGLIGRSLAP